MKTDPSDPGRGTVGLTDATGSVLEPIWIEAIDGPSTGERAKLERGTAIVGTDARCELTLKDPTVSRRHASLELLPGAVKVIDEGSRNGTHYLGARINEARVPIGGTVRVGKTTLRFSSASVSAPAESPRDELKGLIGRAPSMRRMFATLERLGPTDATVLIQGETGVGKEAVARALHALSPRAAAPFVVFDCASPNRELVESELFGHVRGAFTGAVVDRDGAFARAGEGTLCLDALDDMPADLQPRLLRALEAREFSPVGSNQVRQVNARVLATSRRDLLAEVRAGRFREDLYYRVATAVVHVPALRERLEDIGFLSEHFARELRGMDVKIGVQTLAVLQCYAWPGNVRELQGAIARTLLLGEGLETPAPVNAAPGVSFTRARDAVVEQFERDFLAALLERNNGNMSAAARDAGISRSHLYRLMERHQMAASDTTEE